MGFDAKFLSCHFRETPESTSGAKPKCRRISSSRLKPPCVSGGNVGCSLALHVTNPTAISRRSRGCCGRNGRMADINPGQTPFTDLPGALVDEVLQRTEDVGQMLLQSFEHVRRERGTIRTQLQKKGFLSRDSELEYPPTPTSCGIDGSYAVERLLTTDLAAAAGVAVEGLTPPSEKRFWEEPRHQVVVEAEPHNEATGSVLRGLMITMELSLGPRERRASSAVGRQSADFAAHYNSSSTDSGV